MHQPFPKQTNWIVFSGAPCSGKTSILEKLKELGYKYRPEVARGFIEEKLKHGLCLETIRGDEAGFQKLIFPIIYKSEENLDPNELIFLDRALPDCLSYFSLHGLDPKDIWEKCKNFKYKAVFIFEPLELVLDMARNETIEEIEILNKCLKKDYKNLGYEAIIVPAMLISERLKFVLQKLEEKNLITKSH
ncbi:MAG: ATP-binding protein [Candidatus Caenarcaniphilales bacterium]|nr:ATP-binding protein [Candidatus Caenarcaniphilales bacterium]